MIEFTNRQSEIANSQTLELMTPDDERRGDLSLTKRVLYQLSTSAAETLEQMTGTMNAAVTSPLPSVCSTN